MEDLNKFIGIVHEYGRSDKDACDCAGLCTLFYKEIFGYVIDDGLPIGTVETSKKKPLRMLRYLLANFEKVEDVNDLTFGDIVLTKVMNEHHVAVYLRYNKILTQEIPVIYGVTKSCVYRGIQWLPYFVMGFRRKEANHEPSNVNH